MKLLSCSSICCAIGLNSWTSANQAVAQISPDNTLPTNTIVSPNGNSFTIDGGTRAGGNLFHSFSEFSVPTLREAFFNNSAEISNIISRVTGGKISNIDGLIRANGTANLFLLNPAGIIFGPNARLDIGGSFVGSTADSIIFEQNQKFSATDPQAPPLLTINVPLGLQWNRQNTGTIQVRGPGHSLVSINEGFSPIIGAGSSSTGLRVNPGNAIALLGGDVNLEGGILTAPGGHIQLGALREGIVRLNLSDWTGDYSEAIAFGSIVLSRQALADVSGIGRGDLEVRSQNLRMTDGSVILSQNLGLQPAGSIRVDATDDLAIGGSTREEIKSGLHSQTIGEGKAADIAVSTGRLLLSAGGQITATTFSQGLGGKITVNVSDRLEARGYSPFNAVALSGINTITFGSADAGDLILETGSLTIAEGASISSPTFGSGGGGAVRVNAESIVAIGVNPINFIPSSISSTTQGPGDSGIVEINTSTLAVRDGGVVATTSLANGNAGSVTINARESVEVSGLANGSFLPSNVDSSTFTSEPAARAAFGLPDMPIGNSGNVTINTPLLLVTDAARVSVTNDASGNPGILQVNASEIVLSNGGGITAVNNVGSGGDIQLNTRTLELDGGSINASVLDDGSGGNITIRAAESVEVTGRGLPTLEETILTPTIAGTLSLSDLNQGIVSGTNGLGEISGNITIETGRLSITEGAPIATVTLGKSDAGNLIINASESIEISNSIAVTSTLGTGSGGNIEIDTRQLTARSGGQFIATTFGSGRAGEIAIRASESVKLTGTATNGTILNQSALNAGSQGNSSGQGGSLTITTGELTISNEAIVSVSAQGTGDAGDLTINSNILNLENGTIAATSLEGKGGNLDLQLPNLTILRNNSQISTRAGTNETGGGNGGNININSDIIAILENSNITANAFAGAGGNIEINTLGIFADGNSGITASSQFGVNGTVTINNPAVDGSSLLVELPKKVHRNTQEIATGCAAGEGNSFTITGRGGLAEDPTATIRGQTLWQDTEDYTGVTPSSGQGQNQPTLRESQQPIVEATGWVKHPDGTVELVAELPQWYRQEPGQNRCTRRISVTNDQ